MHIGFCLVLNLLWSQVHCQTEFPYVSFRGVTLPNHGYVDLSLVGNASNGSDTVQCHTDLTACCATAQGPHRGDWFFPNNSRMSFSVVISGNVNLYKPDIYEVRGAQRVDLRRRNNTVSPSGIYRCEIPTVDYDISERETVYLGIYGSGGDITISDGVTFAMISDDEFTLTCTSTGGPATTVTWTRDSLVVTEGNETVFNAATAATTAEYTHTLAANTPGEYTCTVANNISSASASYIVEGVVPPTNVMAVQEGPDSIRVTWTPSSGANGYIISYDNDASSSGSEPVNDSSIDELLLTGLLNGAIYTIFIVATGEPFPSRSVEAMNVGLVPGQPSVSMSTTTATSVTLSWTNAGSVVTTYRVMWERDTSGECPNVDENMVPLSGSSTAYTITGLEEDSSYDITVTAFNAAGSSEVTVTRMTMDATPSAPPDSVSISAVTSSSITVQWEMVPCIHRNGHITDYTVRFGIQGQITQTMAAPGDSSGGTYVISNLQSSTTYSIQVAAITGVNRIGPYSSTITEATSVGLSVTSIVSSSSTTLVVSWTLDDGAMVKSYTISYSNTDTDCFTDSDIITGIDGSTMSHELLGLKEGTEYSVTVTAQLASGETIADIQTATTIATTPSASPTSVSVFVINSTAITVQWGMVPCIHRNGDITGFSVRYTGDGSAQNTFVIGGGATMTTISDLRSSVAYVIEVAVVNSDGTGVYSAPQIIVPGQPSVSVTSITATSISLSWSVPSDSVVTSYEVMWRETDSGATEMTSGSLTDTSYTIEQLDSTTIYTITVTASNTGGDTFSLPVIISTGSDNDSRSAETDTAAVIGGVVVAIVLILSVSLTVIVIVVLVLRSRRGQYTTGPSKREAMPPPGATNTLELSKFSGEPTYVDPDVIPTSSNEAYHTVSQTGGTTTDYETVSDPHTVPPSTSHSSQPPTAGD